MKVQMTTSITGEGMPTAGALLEAMSALPPEAFVRTEVWDSQRDGAGWRVSASWEEER
jgi:hypothetical protein